MIPEGQMGQGPRDVMEDGPLISAVILNFQDPSMTLESILAFELAADMVGIQIETIIIDNSGPETGKEVGAWADRRRTVVVNEENRGFAAANNQGFRIARGRYILVLNNDAFATVESIRIGLDYLESWDAAGIWAPGLVFKDGRPQNSTGDIPNLWSHFKEYLLPARFSIHLPEATESGPRFVGTVTGAFMLIRKAALDRAGGFDEDFFFTVEDIDLCVRMKEAGYSIVYDPRALVVHLGGGSQTWKWLHDPQLHKARILFLRKRRGFLVAAFAQVMTSVGLGLRSLLLTAGEKQ